MTATALTLYSRLHCHLCEDMQTQLPLYLEGTGLELNVVYIDDEPVLEQKYGTLVPVLKAGDREICHYFLDTAILLKAITDNT